MWHASVKTFSPGHVLAREKAIAALAGAGDAALGEWFEVGNNDVFHVRRRLSEDERKLAHNLQVRDIRGTPEEKGRMSALLYECPQLTAFFGRAP